MIANNSQVRLKLMAIDTPGLRLDDAMQRKVLKFLTQLQL